MTDVRMHALALIATAAAILGNPSTGAAAPATVDLQVMAPGLKPQGSVIVAVYNDPGAWLAEGKPFLTAVAPVRDGMAVASFKTPPGRYAVVAYQDKNGDGSLDRLPFGWPAEKVGYSGGVRPLFGRPPWDKADFPLADGERTTVFVRLK